MCFGTFHIHCHQSRCPWLHTVTLHVHTNFLPQSQKTVIILYHKLVIHTSWSRQHRNMHIQFISKSNNSFIDIHVDVSISFWILTCLPLSLATCLVSPDVFFHPMKYNFGCCVLYIYWLIKCHLHSVSASQKMTLLSGIVSVCFDKALVQMFVNECF